MFIFEIFIIFRKRGTELSLIKEINKEDDGVKYKVTKKNYFLKYSFVFLKDNRNKSSLWDFQIKKRKLFSCCHQGYFYRSDFFEKDFPS